MDDAPELESADLMVLLLMLLLLLRLLMLLLLMTMRRRRMVVVSLLSLLSRTALRATQVRRGASGRGRPRPCA